MDITHLRFRTALRLQLLRATWCERLVCAVCDHDWGDEPNVIITSGPPGVPPDERVYQVVAFVSECRRCHLCRDLAVGGHPPGAAQDAIAEARMDDLAIWDDDEARAAHLLWVMEWEPTQEWHYRER